MFLIFNFDELQWIKEQSLENHGGFGSLYLLQINGIMHILSYNKTELSWTMSSNYNFVQAKSWIGKDILIKSKELSVISLDKTLVKRHLNY